MIQGLPLAVHIQLVTKFPAFTEYKGSLPNSSRFFT